MYVVINGGGKVGEYLATQLLAHRHQVAIIELDEKKIEHLALHLQHQVLVVRGDGCDSSFQEDAGIESADVFVATTGLDDVNLVSAEIALLIHKVPRCIARVNSPKNERIFRSLGIEAVSSTSVISRLIEREATTGAMHAVMTLTQGNLLVTEVVIQGGDVSRTGQRAGRVGEEAETRGRRVADINLPEGVLLVGVAHDGRMSVVRGSTLLYPGDTVVCVSEPGYEEKIYKALRDELFIEE